MLFDPKHDMSLERFARETRLAPTPTRDLFFNITTRACPRLQLLRTAGKTSTARSVHRGGCVDRCGHDADRA